MVLVTGSGVGVGAGVGVGDGVGFGVGVGVDAGVGIGVGVDEILVSTEVSVRLSLVSPVDVLTVPSFFLIELKVFMKSSVYS